MKRNNIFILSSVLLLLVIPGIALESVFGEKLLVSEGFENTAQISAIDKTSGFETQRFSDGDFELFLGAIDFSPDGFLIGTSSDNKTEEAITLTKLNLMIEGGYPILSADNLLGNNEIYCSGFSFSPEGVAYCMNGDNTLVKFDFDLETEIVVATVTADFNDDGIIDDDDESFGNGLAISSDGVIYFSNQFGLYTLDLDGTLTLVVKWDHNGDETIDEPNSGSGDNFELGYGECTVPSMDFDSTGNLYGVLNCGEEPILLKIGINPSIVLGEDEVGEEVDMADLTMFELERNDGLDEIFEVGPFEATDPITISPFNFDFLLGNTYGTVDDGFDSISAIVTEDGNFIETDDTAEISICGNAELELFQAGLFVECNNTTVSVDSGSVIATLTADDEEIEQLTMTLSAGDAIEFDSLECELTNTGDNDIDVDFDGKTSPIIPGDTLSCLKAIDHYLGYDVKDKARHHHDDDDDEEGDDHDENIIVNLVDEFAGDVDYKIKKVKHLFNPAQVTGGEEIGSEESHLVSYDLKKIKGEPKFKKIKNISVTNQFGDLTVDIKHPKHLLVPSAKSHDAVPEELEKIVINHFKCYDAKESKKTPKFEKRTVDLDDQFGSVTMKVHKVKSLCSPVDKNSEGIINEENYLMCYDLKKIKGEPKFKKINVFTNNQFGSEELKIKKQKELCVPSTITLE